MTQSLHALLVEFKKELPTRVGKIVQDSTKKQGAIDQLTPFLDRAIEAARKGNDAEAIGVLLENYDAFYKLLDADEIKKIGWSGAKDFLPSGAGPKNYQAGKEVVGFFSDLLPDTVEMFKKNPVGTAMLTVGIAGAASYAIDAWKKPGVGTILCAVLAVGAAVYFGKEIKGGILGKDIASNERVQDATSADRPLVGGIEAKMEGSRSLAT